MRVRAALVLVTASVLAPACGGDDGGDGRGTTSGPGTIAAAPTASEPRVSVGAPTAGDEAAPATTTPTTATTTTGATTAAAVQPEGFEAVQATITLADGTPCELCLWLADDGDRRARGLMHVTDLGAADGMAFRFDGPTTARFWMGRTPMPLSIAFFDAAGAFVSTADMEPCLAADEACPRYAADRPYVTAIELPLGDVATLGVGPGSVLTLTDLPCG